MSENEFNYIIQSWNAKIIRLPFNQDWINTDVAYNNKLHQVIGWIKNNGAYVMLDLQWQNETVQIPAIPDSQAIEMWKKLAVRYKDDPAVLYDIHNEAHDVSFAAWQSRASEIIDGIRSVHPKSLIFVSGLNWATDVSACAANPLPYDNIVYSVHAYPWQGGETDWDNNFGNYSDQLPLFVGEFGGYGENLDWGKQFMTYLNAKKLGWTAWSWVDDPFLTTDNRYTPTEFGAIAREMLTRHAYPEQYDKRLLRSTVDFVTSTRATINWKTTNESDSKVLYGLTISYSDTAYAPILLKSHTIKLIELQSEQTYHFKIISADDYGFVAVSSDSTFITATN